MSADFVGRDGEVAELTGLLGDAVRTTGRIVLVSGQAGMGKSRLVAEFADAARRIGTRVLCGRTTEADGAPPYWPWLPVFDELGARDLLDAPAGLDPSSEQFTRLEACCAALATEPGLVVLEDMHRADVASLRLLTRLSERISTTRLMVVVTLRPNPLEQTAGFGAVLDDLARRSATEHLELAGLEAAAVAQLLGADVASAVTQQVTAMSDGNPLLVGELARHLAGGGDLESVPRTVREAIRVRLAARSTPCVQTIQLGAIVGRTFAAGLVATAANRAAIEVLGDLDEAVGAGLVEPGSAPGEFRFVHALVRDAIEATMGAAVVASLHRSVALATEAYAGTGDAQVAELALHWDAASALGDQPTAAHWCERAATVADRKMAWDDAARLYDRALELGGPSATPLDEHRRAIGAARTRLHCDDIHSAVERLLRAADAGYRAGRVDLVAEATLVPEARWLASTELREHALDALQKLPASDHARRARLHAQLVNMGFYSDPSVMDHHCALAEQEARRADDPLADIAAARARHMMSYGPEHAIARLGLAQRLGDSARLAQRPSVGVWEPLWRIDALVELGRLGEALATLPELRRAVDLAGAPMARWHLARVEAALAQATARFGDALDHAQEAHRLFTVLEDPLAADGVLIGFRLGVEMHAGWSQELADTWGRMDPSSAPHFLGELALLGVTTSAAGVGDVDRARAAYSRLTPALGWSPPPALWLHLHALRVDVAARLGLVDDLPPLLDALDRHRGRHVGSGGGVVNYFGPVELWCGIGAAALQRWDDAERDLNTAGEAARTAGAPGFAVHADVERACAAAQRGLPDDVKLAHGLLTDARPKAARLGMTPFVERIDRMLEALQQTTDDGPLSPREWEVAGLVAAGQTNKQIAAALYVSERTAQNHVQHILTKLGLANRTQIATWHHRRH